jgi:beta-phosphoglucomutase-like phosphatase (HAD superfamily)
MPKLADFAAAIFDIDDTLLSNHPPGQEQGLHEASRLEASHRVGQKHGIAALANLSAEDNWKAWRTSPVHTLEGATWRILQIVGLADSDAINFDDPLLQKIVQLKNELHEDTLRTFGAEVPGAGQFVRWLAAHGFQDKLAAASTAVRRDALISLDVVGVRDFFPDKRIITKESFFEHPKPHPMPFILAFESLGLPADTPREKVLAFEDDPRGIMSAKAAGLYTCAITTHYSKQALAALEVAPDLTADSYAEFEQLFQLSA